jgi:hypothetical protein
MHRLSATGKVAVPKGSQRAVHIDGLYGLGRPNGDPCARLCEDGKRPTLITPSLCLHFGNTLLLIAPDTYRKLAFKSFSDVGVQSAAHACDCSGKITNLRRYRLALAPSITSDLLQLVYATVTSGLK